MKSSFSLKNKKVQQSRYYPRFTTQLILSFMVIMFLVLSLSVVIMSNDVFTILQDQSEELTLNRIRQSEYNIATLMDRVDKISKNLILSFGLGDFLGLSTFSELNTLNNHDRVLMLNTIYKTLSNTIINFDFIRSVYLFDEQGMLVGVTPRRNDFVSQNETVKWLREMPFFYEKGDRNSQLLWFGGYTSGDFYDSSESQYNREPLISAVKNVYSVGEGIYTILINLDEEYFSSIYNSTENAYAGRIYVMDNQGMIISDKTGKNLGQYSSLHEEIHNDYGSFLHYEGEVQKQIVYSKLKITGWYLINEIPLELFREDIRDLRNRFFIIVIIGMIVAIFLSSFWIIRMTNPLNILMGAMESLEKGNLETIINKIPSNELGLLVIQFNNMSESIKDLIQDNKRIEEEKRRFEMRALQTQINPHFIYNTLNTIKWMGLAVKADNIVDSINALAAILEPIFRREGDLCTVRDELIYVQQYIKIINYRYGESITMNVSLPLEMNDALLPHFTLQPLVENAVNHGFKDKEYMGTVHITGQIRDKMMILTVEDDGTGIADSDLIKLRQTLNDPYRSKNVEKGIGCENIHHRLKLHFGDEYGLEITSIMDKGTQVNVTLPYTPFL